MLISTILSNSILLIAYMILLNRNGIRIKPHRIDFIIQKKIFSFGIKMLGISIMNMLMMPISKIILADINLKAVAFFEIGSKIVYSVFGIIQKGIYAFLPQMSKYKHELKENVATIKKICSRTSKLSILLSILLFVFLDITAPYWMHIWLGANYDIEILKSFYIIQVGAFFAIFSLPYYYSLMGLGKENICLYESIIRCIANIILLVSLMNIKNLSILVYISFALATIVSNLYVLIKCKIFIKNSI
jgi:O-antigen/teichoic acid export membrane protein